MQLSVQALSFLGKNHMGMWPQVLPSHPHILFIFISDLKPIHMTRSMHSEGHFHVIVNPPIYAKLKRSPHAHVAYSTYSR